MRQVPRFPCSTVDEEGRTIEVRRSLTRLKQRVVTNFMSPLSSAVYQVHDDTIDNLVLGYERRVLHYKGKSPIPCLVDWSSGGLNRFMRDFTPVPCVPFSVDQVLARVLPRRLRKYQQAAESLTTVPLCQKDGVVRTFIKAEKFTKHDADPRLIQPRTERFLLSHAKYIKSIEGVVYSRLAAMTGVPMVAKGFNAGKTAEILRAKWDRFKRPCCISLDASRFDMHVSQSLLRFCHTIYRKFLGNHAEFNRLCEMQLVNFGRATCREGSFRYKVKGRRMSGDMDTSLGNCLIMCAITYQLVGKECEIFNNGDDCLIIGEEGSLPSAEELRGHYRGFGFNVVEEDRVRVFEQIKFCQTQPVWNGLSWTMVRPPLSMSKDMAYIGPKTSVKHWMSAIRSCGLALNSGIPVHQAFYLRLPEVRRKRIERSMLYSCGLTRLSQGMVTDVRAVTDESRLSYERAFGLDPAAQLALESTLTVPQCWENEEIDKELFEAGLPGRVLKYI